MTEPELVCPSCQADLPRGSSWPAGGMRCGGCQATYAARGGIPRFVPSDDYVGNFSFEWLRHRRTQLDSALSQESEQTFRAKTGLTPESVAGRRVLDAGCGMGRFAEVASRWGGEVTAVDLSLAVEAARDNLGDRPNVRIYQANLFALPFKPASFDVIYSIGVLHHTPNCEAAFRNLVRYLAPGGIIVTWLYEQDHGLWMRCSDAYRRVTTRLPSRVLHALAHVAIPWYYLTKLPALGRACYTILPISTHPKAEWRVLDTFDWYSPKYQSKHTYPEVARWFESEGLSRIRLLDVPVAVSGMKGSAA